MATEVLIGIGSNLDNPEQQVFKAFDALSQLPNSKLIKSSSLYRSVPQGPQDQDLFINAVSLIETDLSPHELLGELKQIEEKFGRIKIRHWGERIIDLDILFFGKESVDSPDLSIPHIQALNRDFVMIPALEITPDWKLPEGKALADFQNQCLDHKLVKLSKAKA